MPFLAGPTQTAFSSSVKHKSSSAQVWFKSLRLAGVGDCLNVVESDSRRVSNVCCKHWRSRLRFCWQLNEWAPKYCLIGLPKVTGEETELELRGKYSIEGFNRSACIFLRDKSKSFITQGEYWGLRRIEP